MTITLSDGHACLQNFRCLFWLLDDYLIDYGALAGMKFFLFMSVELFYWKEIVYVIKLCSYVYLSPGDGSD